MAAAATVEGQLQQPAAGEHLSEPEVHGLQGVTFIEPEAPPAAPVAAAVAAAAAGPPQPPPRKFKPRERSVPSSALGRVAGFAGLGASLLYGTMRESVSRAFRGPSAGGEAHPTSSFLTEENAERLANALCRMRGAALKIGQVGDQRHRSRAQPAGAPRRSDLPMSQPN